MSIVQPYSQDACKIGSQCVCCPGVGGRLIWNWLSGDQLISTQSVPPWLFSEVLPPQISPLSCFLLPKLSTLVDCCFGWMAQHLHTFWMLLASHCHLIVVLPLSLSNCHCPIIVLKLPPLTSSTSLPLSAAVASLPSPSPLPLPLPSPLLSPSPLPSPPSLSSPSLPSLSM
jgi:hypothetical protein